MWDMKKEHRPPARVNNMGDSDYHSSVVSAPDVDFLGKGRSFYATTEKYTYPVSNVRIPIAITNGLGAEVPSTENTSGRSIN